MNGLSFLLILLSHNPHTKFLSISVNFSWSQSPENFWNHKSSQTRLQSVYYAVCPLRTFKRLYSYNIKFNSNLFNKINNESIWSKYQILFIALAALGGVILDLAVGNPYIQKTCFFFTGYQNTIFKPFVCNKKL